MGKDNDEIVVKIYPEKKNNSLFNNVEIFYLIFLVSKKNWIVFDKKIIVEIVNTFSTNNVIKLIKHYLGKIIVFY